MLYRPCRPSNNAILSADSQRFDILLVTPRSPRRLYVRVNSLHQWQRPPWLKHPIRPSFPRSNPLTNCQASRHPSIHVQYFGLSERQTTCQQECSPTSPSAHHPFFCGAIESIVRAVFPCSNPARHRPAAHQPSIYIRYFVRGLCRR